MPDPVLCRGQRKSALSELLKLIFKIQSISVEDDKTKPVGILLNRHQWFLFYKQYHSFLIKSTCISMEIY